MKFMKRRLPVFSFTMLAFLAIDQASKLWARANLSPEKSLSLIKGFLSLTLVQNKGMAFGFFQEQNRLFLVAAVVIVSITLFYLLIYRPASVIIRVALGLIVAGSIGNLIDRTLFKQVTDFLDFHFWPVFNVADTSLVSGAALLLAKNIFKFRR